MPKNNSNRLLAGERRREISACLVERQITVEEVVQRFGVSAVTARGDLDALSESGALVRSHGGGIKPLAAAPEHPLKVREGMHHEEKVRIAQAAARLIRPLQTMMICSGSTSAELARKSGGTRRKHYSDYLRSERGRENSGMPNLAFSCWVVSCGIPLLRSLGPMPNR